MSKKKEQTVKCKKESELEDTEDDICSSSCEIYLPIPTLLIHVLGTLCVVSCSTFLSVLLTTLLIVLNSTFRDHHILTNLKEKYILKY